MSYLIVPLNAPRFVGARSLCYETSFLLDTHSYRERIAGNSGVNGRLNIEGKSPTQTIYHT